MSSIGGSHIYLGPWVNWDHGLVLGSTLTLSARDGGLFNSFLATFVTIVGAQLWRILSYVFHQVRSSRGPQDGLHHQHQNVFRNSSSPGGAAWSFLRMSSAWRHKTTSPILRSLPWAILAIVYMCVFAILSIFQSQTTKSTGDDRLVIGDTCGYWKVDTPPTQQTAFAFTQKTTNDTILAANYARACYGGSPNQLQCNLYPAVAIPWTEDSNAECPFAAGTCVTDGFKMDTGLVDSHKMLGMNAPRHERVQYRKVTTCAPLHVKDFATVILGTDDNDIPEGDIVYEIDYGHILSDTASVLLNYTFKYNTHARVEDFSYSLGAVFALAQFAGNSWLPIPAINRTDADISLVSVSANSVEFDAPNSDPVFSANDLVSYVSYSGRNVSWYDSDYYISAIGCAEHHQICNPNNNICTPLSGAQPLLKESLDPALDLNIVQIGAMQRIFYNAIYTSIYETVYSRKSSALRAQETLSGLQQAPLPDNQWQIEVSNWFDAGLARMQRMIVEYATGPTNVIPGLSVFIPDDIVSKAMCYSQKISDPQGTISFSVIGVAIILSVGGFIIATSLVLDTVVGWVQGRLKRGEYARLNWVLDDKLQLQRLAFEGANMGHWKGHTAGIPTTDKGEKFGGWDDVDPDRPTLIRTRLENGIDQTLGSERQSFIGKKEDYQQHRASVTVHELGPAE